MRAAIRGDTSNEAQLHCVRRLASNRGHGSAATGTNGTLSNFRILLEDSEVLDSIGTDC